MPLTPFDVAVIDYAQSRGEASEAVYARLDRLQPFGYRDQKTEAELLDKLERLKVLDAGNPAFKFTDSETEYKYVMYFEDEFGHKNVFTVDSGRKELTILESWNQAETIAHEKGYGTPQKVVVKKTLVTIVRKG